jgi:hypothetical protein
LSVFSCSTREHSCWMFSRKTWDCRQWSPNNGIKTTFSWFLLKLMILWTINLNKQSLYTRTCNQSSTSRVISIWREGEREGVRERYCKWVWMCVPVGLHEWGYTSSTVAFTLGSSLQSVEAWLSRGIGP